MAEQTGSSLYEWLSVVIKRGAVVVKDRSIVKCCCEETFDNLVRKVAPKCKEEKIVRIVICATEKFVDVHDVSSDAPVSICRIFNCKHCCIYLEAANPVASFNAIQVRQNNAFAVLMANSRRVYLPPKLTPPEGKQLRSDQRLQNDLIGTVMLYI